MPDRIDRILYLLFAGMMIFSIVVITVNVFWPNDGPMFTTFSNILAGFTASFFTRMQGARGSDSSVNIGNTLVAPAAPPPDAPKTQEIK